METRDPNKKSYLGDSVYVAKWNHGVVLTTENGYGPSNEIYLEDFVCEALKDYLKRNSIWKNKE